MTNEEREKIKRLRKLRIHKENMAKVRKMYPTLDSFIHRNCACANLDSYEIERYYELFAEENRKKYKQEQAGILE